MADVIERNDSGVLFVDEIVRSQYGPKAVLQGNTYEAFVEDGLKEKLVWDDTHQTWDGDREAWIVDANEDSLSRVREMVEELGYSWGGVSVELSELLMDSVSSEEEPWRNRGVSLSVTYESSRADGELKVKSGIVVSVSPGHSASVDFIREDGQVMTVRGNALFTDSSEYPYVGKVVDVVVKYDVDDNHAHTDEVVV